MDHREHAQVLQDSKGAVPALQLPGAGVRDADMYPARCGPRDLAGSFPPPQLPGGLVASTLKKAKGISQVWHVKATQI